MQKQVDFPHFFTSNAKIIAILSIFNAINISTKKENAINTTVPTQFKTKKKRAKNRKLDCMIINGGPVGQTISYGISPETEGRLMRWLWGGPFGSGKAGQRAHLKSMRPWSSRTDPTLTPSTWFRFLTGTWPGSGCRSLVRPALEVELGTRTRRPFISKLIWVGV